MAISSEQRQQAIEQFRGAESDTGSSSVQISLLTQRINHLTEHMRTNKKDYSSRRGLLRLVSKRRGLLDYVRRHDPQRYLDIIGRLGIRK
jgi:small subunit ribosomal protein S15